MKPVLLFVAVLALLAAGCVQEQTTPSAAPSVAPSFAPSVAPSVFASVAAPSTVPSAEPSVSEPSALPSPSTPLISDFAAQVAAASSEVLGVKITIPQVNDRQWIASDYLTRFYYAISIEKPLFNAFDSPSNVANLTGLNTSRVKPVEIVSTSIPSTYGFRVSQFCFNKAYLVTTEVHEQIFGGEPRRNYAMLLAQRVVDVCPE